MSKVVLHNLANLQNETTAVNSINANNATIVAEFDNTLSRDGSSPNGMNTDFDMNSFRIINLPAPLEQTEPLRLQDLTNFIGSGGGTGQGDLLAVNNLSDVLSPAISFRNLGGLDFSGVVSLFSNTTLTTTAFGKLHFLSGTGNFTVTLPSPTGNAGKLIAFMVDNTTNATALYTVSTPTGVIGRSGANIVMWANESVVLRCNGTNWETLAVKQIPFVGTLLRSTDQASSSSGVVVSFTQSRSPSGLSLPFVGTTFQAPRANRYIFSLFCAQNCGGSPTVNVIYLADASAAPLTNFIPTYGALTVGTGATTLQLDCTTGLNVYFGSRIDGTSPNIVGSAIPVTMTYTEICSGW